MDDPGSIGYDVFVAIAAVVAVVVAIMMYLSVRARNASGLRVQLEMAFNDLDAVSADVEDSLQQVHDSHVEVLAASGLDGSSEMKLFQEDLAKDRARWSELVASAPRRDGGFERLSLRDLERRLIEVNAFRPQVAGIRHKYQQIIQSDEARRKELRRQTRARAEIDGIGVRRYGDPDVQKLLLEIRRLQDVLARARELIGPLGNATLDSTARQSLDRLAELLRAETAINNPPRDDRDSNETERAARRRVRE